MIQSRDKLFEWLKLNGTPYWKLKCARGVDLKGTSPNADELTTEQSIDHLNRTLDTLGDGMYSIEAWEKKGQTKEWKRELIQLGNGVNNQQQVQGMPAIGALEIEQIADRKLQEYKRELERERMEAKIAELEARNKELELELNSVEKRIYHRVSPFLGTIYKALGVELDGDSQVISGQTNVQDAEQRLEAAFERWEKNENDVIGVIEKIANMSEKDKQMYDIARNMLMK